jgi:hypothetical protein
MNGEPTSMKSTPSHGKSLVVVDVLQLGYPKIIDVFIDAFFTWLNMVVP